MLQRKKLGLFGLLFSILCWGSLLSVEAQDPRPTPTIEPYPNPLPTTTPRATPDIPLPTPPPDAAQASGERGTIQGMVYQDVDGNGQCVNTGVTGEGPVAGVDIKFVSSDEQTVLTLQSGPDGIFGLAAAGYSYWGVTAVPGPEWIVTSEETLNVPLYEDSRVATDINFCVQAVQSLAAPIFLPAAGGSGAMPLLNLALIAGLLLMVTGAGIYWRQNRSVKS